MDIAQLADRLTAETAKIIYGKETQIRLIVMALLSQGHVLLEDLPGVGKTTLIKTLAAVSGCRSKRIQFVPDLLPADILGMNIYDRNRGEFRHLPGPVFTNLLLADEINRAVPRTQSALLEAMEERQVTIDGETLPLPTPFVVMATQNPVESESTFRLPAAQMDRFLIRLSMGYPAPEEERRMLFSLGDSIPLDGLETVTSPEELVAAQRLPLPDPGVPGGGRLLGFLGGGHPQPPHGPDGGQPPGLPGPVPGRPGLGRHGGPLLRYPGRHPGPDPPRAGPPAAAHQRGPALRCHR